MNITRMKNQLKKGFFLEGFKLILKINLQD